MHDECRARDPWEWIDENLLDVDRPIVGPLIGMTALIIAAIALLYTPAVIGQNLGRGVQGTAIVTSIECSDVVMRPSGYGCVVTGSFVADDESVHLPEVMLHLRGAEVGSSMRAQEAYSRLEHEPHHSALVK